MKVLLRVGQRWKATTMLCPSAGLSSWGWLACHRVIPVPDVWWVLYVLFYLHSFSDFSFQSILEMLTTEKVASSCFETAEDIAQYN